METPDLCTALINMIESQFKTGNHIGENGTVDQTWLYSVIAMSNIGHSRQLRYIHLAAASILDLDEETKTKVLTTYALPSQVYMILNSGEPSWPSPLPSPSPSSPYVEPSSTVSEEASSELGAPNSPA